MKEKVKNQSLIITPNMIRFLALTLLKNDESLIKKIGNVVVSADSRAQLFSRIFGSSIIGLVAGLFQFFPLAILMTMIYYDSTANCGYKCHDYFELIPKESSVRVYSNELTENLLIGENDGSRQMIIYNPSKVQDEGIIGKTKKAEIKRTRTYIISRKQAKEVKFSDFQKKYPILRRFKNLEEPRILQTCWLIDDAPDVFNIRID
jgi:hypothetical protein